jgi:hypothetical protein
MPPSADGRHTAQETRLPGDQYNDRSPAIAAMKAHLRASPYGDQEDRGQLGPMPRLTNDAVGTHNGMRSFLHLSRRYDTQARANFKREAALFLLIVALSIWSIHAVQTARGNVRKFSIERRVL